MRVLPASLPRVANRILPHFLSKRAAELYYEACPEGTRMVSSLTRNQVPAQAG